MDNQQNQLNYQDLSTNNLIDTIQSLQKLSIWDELLEEQVTYYQII